MHNMEFIGKKAPFQPKRVLILGESHHWSANDKRMSEEERRNKADGYSTARVVYDYLLNFNTCIGEEREQCYRFFDNIVKAFGIDPEMNREYFWEQVYFGNYIDELCGVGDMFAVKRLNRQENRKKYNRQLFSFLLKHEIDFIFCFSRRVYNSLPPLEGLDKEALREKGNLHRLDKCIYYPGKREYMDESLEKPVIVYGLHHPSRGFSHQAYKERLSAIVANEGLFLEI